MSSEKKFWTWLLVISFSFIILLITFLLFIIFPFHIEQMKTRSRETVSHLQFVLPKLNSADRQQYLERMSKVAQDLSYLLLMDRQGNALAHSNPERVGMNFDEAGLRKCLATGETIEQIYIRDADKPSSPYHGEKTIDILSPYYSSAGRIEGAVNVGLSLAAIERAKMHYISVSAAGTILWLIFISVFAASHIRTMRQKLATDNALIESEAKYRFLVENSSDITYKLDIEGIITFIGPQIRRYGFEPEEVQGQSVEIFIYQADVEQVKEILRKSIKSEISTVALFRITDKMNKIFWLETSGSVIKGEDGRLMGFSGTLRDVTQRLQAEKELSDTKALLMTAIDQFPAGILVADAPDCRIRHCNSELLSLRGNTTDELLNIPFPLHSERWQFYNTDGTPADPARLPLTRAILQGEKVSNAELTIMRSGKEKRILLTNAAPVRNSEGMIIAGIAMFTDITDVKRMEEQLRQSQKMEVMGQLISGIAHDFNNMLGGILGSAEILALKLRGNPDLKSYIDMIQKGAISAAELTKNLLAYARKGKISSTAIDIHESLREAIALLGRTIDKRIEIRLVLKATDALITGDPALLVNAFLNLGLNARDAMPTGGILTFATTNINIDESYCQSHPNMNPGLFIEVNVSDTGTGMTTDICEKIFEPFFTTKEFGRGTGLGLAAVQGTVQEHGGSINVYSEPGKGSTFRILFPAERNTGAASAAIEEDLVRGTGCILLIDDEILIRNIVHSQLTELGYDVLLAENGEQGIEIFRREQEKISLVMIDLIMPKISGQETMKRLLAIDPGVKILLQSGFNYSEGMDELIKTGAAFIQKPFPISTLGRIIGQIIKGL